MQMNESQIVPASQDKVWAGLNDPAVLAKCIPGCQKLDVTAPNEMTATVVVKVGPVKANFSGKVTLYPSTSATPLPKKSVHRPSARSSRNIAPCRPTWTRPTPLCNMPNRAPRR